MYGGAPCPADKTDTDMCNTDVFCPGWLPDNYVKRCNYPSVDCEVSDWGEWGLCSQSCGGGFIIIIIIIITIISISIITIIIIIIITVTIIFNVSQV